MSTMPMQPVRAPADAKEVLGAWSTELTVRDRRALEAAPRLLKPGAEVFIAALPDDSPEQMIATAAELRRCGLTPSPHVAARKIGSRAELDRLLGRLSDAGVDRALVLGGDRDRPAGEFDSALQLIRTGLLQRHGMKRIFVSCYPERHPRIADEALETARAAKLRAAADAGLTASLISQFCFDAQPIVRLAERMRALGQTAPLRVGLAGPARRSALVRYALMCGVGPSLRALTSSRALVRNAAGRETPDALVEAIAQAQAARPALGLEGVHLFSFGALATSAEWANRHF